MTTTRQLLAADLGDIASGTHVEVPVNGPGEANTLLVICGVAIMNLDILTSELTNFSFLIETECRLLSSDSIMREPTAYVTLSSIQADDSTPITISLLGARAFRSSSNAMSLDLDTQAFGDTGILRVGFQINALIRRDP